MKIVYERKMKISAEKEKKRKELLKREFEQMSPIRGSLNRTQIFGYGQNSNTVINRSKSTVMRPIIKEKSERSESGDNSDRKNHSLNDTILAKTNTRISKNGKEVGIFKSLSNRRLSRNSHISPTRNTLSDSRSFQKLTIEEENHI